MRTLGALTAANLKSFLRDRYAVFWTLAFPVIFIVLFGLIFSGGGGGFDVGYVDEDQTAASAALRAAFAQTGILKLKDFDREEALAEMKAGRLRGVVVVPAGLGNAVTRAAAGQTPVTIEVSTDPSQATASQTIRQVVGSVVDSVNLALSGGKRALVVEDRPIQTQELSNTAFLVPGILGMALMQLGLFGAVPLVAQREKLILKRLSATPLRRWALVGSNVLMRLALAIVQAVLIVSIGVLAFGVVVLGPLITLGFVVVMGAAMFIGLGYLIASFAPTEESTNGIVSVINFPMMFLAGSFFPIELMPGFLQTTARVIPLTYLNDALRQVMVNGAPFAPLPVDIAVLVVWLLACLGISFRFFHWE